MGSSKSKAWILPCVEIAVRSITEQEHPNKLRALPCLSHLSADELELIERKSYVKTIAKNDMLFSSSDELKYIFIL
ncbi:MAG: hypothetical protein HQK94_19060, partial [Nitrospirae bacterium]|nr:hypothetical protein [Nitrospirota bacterium]